MYMQMTRKFTISSILKISPLLMILLTLIQRIPWIFLKLMDLGQFFTRLKCYWFVAECLVLLFRIKLNNIPQSFVKFTENLSIIIDSDLRFREHVNKKVKRLFAFLKTLYSSYLLNVKLKNSYAITLFYLNLIMEMW